MRSSIQRDLVTWHSDNYFRRRGELFLADSAVGFHLKFPPRLLDPMSILSRLESTDNTRDFARKGPDKINAPIRNRFRVTWKKDALGSLFFVRFAWKLVWIRFANVFFSYKNTSMGKLLCKIKLMRTTLVKILMD